MTRTVEVTSVRRGPLGDEGVRGMIVQRRPGVTSEVVDGQAVLIAPAGKEVITLNAVGTLVWGGIIYMTSEVMDKRDLARKRIQAAVWGLVLLLGAYIILNTINPRGLLRTSTFWSPAARERFAEPHPL